MSAAEVHALPTQRTELEVAADTVAALLSAGVVPIHKRHDAVAAAGLVAGDLAAAEQRRKQRGFLPPRRRETADEPVAPVFPQQQEASKQTRRYRRSNPAPGVRRCVRCELVRPVSEFPFKNPAKGHRRSYCQPCWNERQRERYLSVRKEAALNAARLTFTVVEGDEVDGLACMDCGQPFVAGHEVTGSTSLRHVACPEAS